MKKNWTIFIVLVVAAYAFFFYDQNQKQQAYKRSVEQYQADWEEWKIQREQEDAERRERLAKLNAERAQRNGTADAMGSNSENSESGSSSPTATPDNSGGDTISMPDGEQVEIFTVLTMPRHTVDTELYHVIISELGARPISWQIKSSRYVTNVGLEDDTVTTTSLQIIPQVSLESYREFPLELAGSQAQNFNDIPFELIERVDVPGGNSILRFKSLPLNDMTVIKEFTFHGDSYLAELRVDFQNGTETRKRLGTERGFGIRWGGGFEEPGVRDRVHGQQTAILAIEGELETRDVDRDDVPIEIRSELQWGGLEKKFFTALMVPDPETPFSYGQVAFRGKNDAPEYQIKGGSVPHTIELFHPQAELQPGERVSRHYQVYVGPKNMEAIQDANFQLQEDWLNPTAMIFHWVPLKMTWLRPLTLLLLKILKMLEGFLGSWGLAVIGTTIIVRLVVYPLTHWAMKNQIRTMLEQKKIRPEMERLQKKYKSDPMKRNQAVMQLYRDHNVNPLGFMRGCFPILLQMPIFLGLYVVFDQSVELRGKSFLWIEDLSQPDRLIVWNASLPLIGNSLHLLPILMAVTNFLQMKIMQTTQAMDATQERIQKQMQLMMPVMFLFFLYNLPSGLILYWVVSNIWGICQSYLTKRYIAAHDKTSEPPRETLEPST